MVLQRQTFLGLTYGQIISWLCFFGGILTAYADIQAKITRNDAQLVLISAQVISIKQEFEKHKDENTMQFRQAFEDTRMELTKINDKLDDLIERK
jgi:hypothetical protein